MDTAILKMKDCKFSERRTTVNVRFRSIRHCVSGNLCFCWRSRWYCPSPHFPRKRALFEVLVVGDSHISGQGLKPQNKFYSLVVEWLQNEVVGKGRKIDLKVKAHAGSRIDIHREELAEMKKVGDDVNKYYYDEANISSPSIDVRSTTPPRSIATQSRSSLSCCPGASRMFW